jgi:hypothetical protein
MCVGTLAENIQIEALAELAELSPFHFAQVFRREVGMRPRGSATPFRAEGRSARFLRKNATEPAGSREQFLGRWPMVLPSPMSPAFTIPVTFSRPLRSPCGSGVAFHETLRVMLPRRFDNPID